MTVLPSARPAATTAPTPRSLSSADDGVERRAELRHGIRLEVSIEHAEGVLTGESRDVSVNGMRVSTPAPLAVSTHCRVRFRLEPLGERVDIPAVVRWSTADWMGLQFSALRARHVWGLHRLLRAID